MPFRCIKQLPLRVCRISGRIPLLRCLQQPPLSGSKKLHFSSSSRVEENESIDQNPPFQQDDKLLLSHKSPDYDPNKPSIDTPVDDHGTLLRRNLVVSSAVKKPSSLITGLSGLLHRPQQLLSDPMSSWAFWTLEPKGDTIKRVFAFTTETQAHQFRDRINAVGAKMNHHASVDFEETSSGASSDLVLVTVRCTTHRPPGLSMRDVKLAHEINELEKT